MDQSARLVVVGGAIGFVTAYAAGSALTKIVYGVSATDPISLALSVVLLFATALLASVVPVRRALRVDPMDTLRGVADDSACNAMLGLVAQL